MTINYFFSRHEAKTEMLELLGGPITQQFMGSISAVQRSGDTITFMEQLGSETTRQSIPVTAGMRVVIVAPIGLQAEWVRAMGADGHILLPQNNRIMLEDGTYEFQFAGLKKLIKVEIVTEDFLG